MDEQTLHAIEEAVERAFGVGVKDKRYIDVSRIPLICQSIVQIGKDIAELKERVGAEYVTQDQFAPIKSVVYGLVGIILMAVVGALTAMVLK